MSERMDKRCNNQKLRDNQFGLRPNGGCCYQFNCLRIIIEQVMEMHPTNLLVFVSSDEPSTQYIPRKYGELLRKKRLQNSSDTKTLFNLVYQNDRHTENIRLSASV